MPELPIGTVTFLFTEMVGTGNSLERYDSAMPATRALHDTILREAVEKHHGTLFQSVTKGGHAVFVNAIDAVSSAVDIQRQVTVESRNVDGPVRIRMALHTGFAEPQNGDYFGPLLIRAMNLLATGHGGQILLSLVTAELVRDQIPPDQVLTDLGVHRLHDLIHPEHIFQLVVPGLPSDFPTLNTLDRYLHNLPAQTTALVGREWEAANIYSLVLRDDVRLVTLTGPGGSGKTRLAIQAAANLIDRFEGGVFFISLAATSDSSLVASAIAHGLHVIATGGSKIGDVLKEYLSDQQILLVLDNFEQVLDAGQFISELISATSRLKFLITSRSSLRLSGEHDFIVPPLSLPDPAHLPPFDHLQYYEAVNLFIERAQAVQPSFRITEANAATVVKICHRLDGLPLAIELAAARCKLLPPAALLARLNDPLAFLVGGPRDVPARQQTLRATIEWSYNLLPKYEQTLFCRLAIFSAGCTLEAIETVCDGNGSPEQTQKQGASIMEAVADLLNQNLIMQAENEVSEPRLGMLDTVHQYALDCLSASGELDVLQRRHADYYLALAEVADAKLRGPEQGQWLTRLETELDDLRSSLKWYQASDPDRGLRMACALWRFWEMHSHLGEGRAWLDTMIQASSKSSDPDYARGLNGSGVLAYLQGDYQQATIFLKEGKSIFQDLHNNEGLANILRSLGLVAWFQGNLDEARKLLEKSIDLFHSEDLTWEIADAMHWLGHVVLDQGDLITAKALFTDSLALFRKTGDQRNIALPLKDFGMITSSQGDLDSARTLYEESLTLSRSVNDTWHVAETLQRLGDLARAGGDLDRAGNLSQESLKLWRKMDNKAGIAESLNLLGEVAQLNGKYQQATAYYTESLSLFRTLGSKRIIAGVLHNLGEAALSDHAIERAANFFRESLALNAEIDFVPGVADCLVGLAAIAAAMGHFDRGAQLLGAADQYLGAVRGYMPLANWIPYEQAQVKIRAQLDEPEFAREFAKGQTWSLQQAVEFALAQPRSSEQAASQALPAPARSTSLAYPAGLTEREITILRLVAQGLTDAQVAERLFISHRTVNGHLRSIYNKLNVSTRTAAVAYAMTHGLI